MAGAYLRETGSFFFLLQLGRRSPGAPLARGRGEHLRRLLRWRLSPPILLLLPGARVVEFYSGDIYAHFFS
jgi:hypothetical protein